MILIDKKGHLDEEGIALIAEGLMDAEVYKRIPDHLLDHIDECLECKQKVLDIYEIISNNDETREGVSMKYAKPGQSPVSHSAVKKWIFPKQNIAWISAAAALIIFASIYFVAKSFNQTDHEQLFSENFSPYQNLLTMKGDSASSGSDAMYFYDMKMWDSANLYFNKAKGTDETALNFYHANALLAGHNTKEAILYFELVINGEDDRFRTQAKWYLALAYLQINQLEESKEILNELQLNTDVYGKKANDLLERIK